MKEDELFDTIKKLIDQKKTFPKMLTFIELKRNVQGNAESRQAFKDLVSNKRIRVREGINTNMVEIIK